MFSWLGLIVGSACTSDHNHDHDGHTHEGIVLETAAVEEWPALEPRTAEYGSPEEYDHLLDIYDKAALDLEANPSDQKALLSMAEVFIQEARITGNFGYTYDAALSLLDKVEPLTVSNSDLRFQMLALKGTVLLSQHKFEEALVVGEEAVALNPYSAYAYGIQVDAHVELGHYAKAVEFSDKMVGTRPDLRSYSRVSYLREIHGEVEGAMEAMEMAISAGYPGMEETAWCRVTLARLHMQYGDLTQAEMQIAMALGERPDYPHALALWGAIELRKGNLEESEKLLLQAAELMPNPGVEETLVQLYSQWEKPSEAEAHRTLALERYGVHAHEDHHGHDHGHEHAHDHGHSHETGFEIARYYLQYTDQYDEALTQAMVSYQERPENIDVNEALAGIHYMRGDYAAAQMHLTKAQATGSQSPSLQTLAGLIHLAVDESSEGKAALAASFATNPYQMGKLADLGRAAL